MRVRESAVLCLGFLLLVLPGPAALAWDETAHQLGAYVTWDSLGPSARDRMIRLLREHPRFEEDFLDEMPREVAETRNAEYYRWLFGRAAIWPDHVHGLSDELQTRYDRPAWHRVDGRWVRGKAQFQGNIYVQATPLPDIEGRSGDSLDGEADVDNAVLALEYALQRLRDDSVEPAERAIALCWTLHLVAELHQPLHTGALVSGERFPEGDRGGNLIATPEDSLHARWDSIPGLRSFERTLEELIQWADDMQDTQPTGLDIEGWLQESRLLLQSAVYTPAIRSTISAHEQSSDDLPVIEFGANYQQRMRRVIRQRIALGSARTSELLSGL